MDETNKLSRRKLKEKLKVYCPIMKANLYINSTLIEQMGDFTQFVLYSLGKGFTIDEINKTIELGEYLIREEIFHLEKWGLIESNQLSFELTELGKSYFKVIEFVEYVNNSSTNVQINCFNGIIMEDDGILINKDLCTDDVQRLRVEIVKELYQNKNYGNSKEFFINKFNSDINEKYDLSDDEIDSINVSINYQKGNLFKLFYLDHIDSVDMILNIEDAYEVDISIVRNIIKLKMKLENYKLDKYRYTLDTLKNINVFDSELLSPKAKNILAIWQEEQELQTNIKDVFYDTATNQIITDFTQNSCDYNCYKLNVPQYYDVNELDYLELVNILNVDENYKVQLGEGSILEFYTPINSKNLQKEIGDGQ